MPHGALAIAPERNVKIVAQERTQRDVPAPPEVRDALGLVRRIEILQELEADHPAQADGHVGITGEIEVDLERVSQRAEPGIRRGKRLGIERGIRNPAHRIGQQDLLGKAEDEQGDSGGKLLPGVRAADELIGHRVVADDRPGNELGKERNVASEIDERPDGRGRAAIDVDGVAEGMERVERDPDRQGDRKHRTVPAPNQASTWFRLLFEEQEILEEPERAQAHDDGARHDPEAEPRADPWQADQPSADIVHNGDPQHQEDEPGIPPTVEDVACEQPGAC